MSRFFYHQYKATKCEGLNKRSTRRIEDKTYNWSVKGVFFPWTPEAWKADSAEETHIPRNLYKVEHKVGILSKSWREALRKHEFLTLRNPHGSMYKPPISSKKQKEIWWGFTLVS